MLTALFSLLTVLSWFFVVSKAGGFAQLAMLIFYVPGYLLTYGLLYLVLREPVRAASKVVLPLFALLVLAVLLFPDPLWRLLQAMHLVGSGV